MPQKVRFYTSLIAQADCSVGIGLTIAEYLISHSHNVIVLARSHGPLDKLCNDHPRQVRALVGDLTDFSFAKQSVDLAIHAFGQLDSLVVNHGAMFGVNRIADCDLEEWRKMFDVNLFSAVAFVSSSFQGNTCKLTSCRPKPLYLSYVRRKGA